MEVEKSNKLIIGQFDVAVMSKMDSNEVEQSAKNVYSSLCEDKDLGACDRYNLVLSLKRVVNSLFVMVGEDYIKVVEKELEEQKKQQL